MSIRILAALVVSACLAACDMAGRPSSESNNIVGPSGVSDPQRVAPASGATIRAIASRNVMDPTCWTGVPNVAPECLNLAPGDFVAPGQTFTETEDEEGDEKYQCCIHPWMRLDLHVTEK